MTQLYYIPFPISQCILLPVWLTRSLNWTLLALNRNGRHFTDATYKPIFRNKNLYFDIYIYIYIYNQIRYCRPHSPTWQNSQRLYRFTVCFQTGDKPIPHPFVTQICDAIWRHKYTMSERHQDKDGQIIADSVLWSLQWMKTGDLRELIGLELNTKDCLYSYRNVHYKDKTVMRPSYFCNWNTYTGVKNSHDNNITLRPSCLYDGNPYTDNAPSL